MIDVDALGPRRALDLTTLRSNSLWASYFGLGFIIVKLSERERAHFYHPDLPVLAESLHDHRYAFTSTVLRGRLTEEVFELADDPDLPQHTVDYIDCHGNCTEKPPGSVVRGLRHLGTHTHLVGDQLRVHEDIFHRVRPVFEHGPVVTRMLRSPVTKRWARVIREGDTPPAPFDNQFASRFGKTRLWNLVGECLEAPLRGPEDRR